MRVCVACVRRVRASVVACVCVVCVRRVRVCAPCASVPHTTQVSVLPLLYRPLEEVSPFPRTPYRQLQGPRLRRKDHRRRRGLKLPSASCGSFSLSPGRSEGRDKTLTAEDVVYLQEWEFVSN